MTPPPATITGFFAAEIMAAAFCKAKRSALVRGICHTFFRNKSTGKSNASACTSCGIASVTAPVSEGEVKMRMTFGNAAINCSGRLIRSQYFDTGLKQSLTDTSLLYWYSSCCNTGSTARVAKISPGNNKTGIRLIVAVAAPVIMLVAPGPTEDVHTNAPNLFFTLA